MVREVQGKARYDIVFVGSQAVPEEFKLPLLNRCCWRSGFCLSIESFIGDTVFLFDPHDDA